MDLIGCEAALAMILQPGSVEKETFGENFGLRRRGAQSWWLCECRAWTPLAWRRLFLQSHSGAVRRFHVTPN